tara:strand:- start:12625 stop:13593 length:969 start_codon:yes stop_codon:yes gene_type:complete
MSRILTGIQSTGTPHLGNLLGAIIPSIELSKDSDNECLFFIADLHSFTTIRDPKILRENTYATAAVWLSFGFDTNKNLLYKQSDVTEVCELTWYLNCFTPYQRLQLSHSFKDKSNRLSEINAGLFTYPILMASDILLYDADLVPVGKDQIQHLEITRSIASKFNYKYPDTFIVPSVKIDEKVMIVPGTDGQKMSKSYGNVIDIFLEKKKLRKQVMSIKTDSKSLEDPKDTDNCNIFNLYKLIASKDQINQLNNRYKAGNFGYGDAKNELYEIICEKYSEQIDKFHFLMNNKNLIDQELENGAKKAKLIAKEVLSRVRKNIGY